MEVLWVVLGIVVVLVLAGVVIYNRFVSQKNLIRDAWANIDTELRRRYDLIPNIVETVKGYAAHEREVLENVTRARAMATGATGSPAAQAAAEGPLVAALRQLFAVVENYPDLKANQNFLALQAELTNTEDRLQTARRFYNANVREYNRRVQSVPVERDREHVPFRGGGVLRGRGGPAWRRGRAEGELRAGCAGRVVRQPVRAVDGSAGHTPGGDSAAAGAGTPRPTGRLTVS